MQRHGPDYEHLGKVLPGTDGEWARVHQSINSRDDRNLVAAAEAVRDRARALREASKAQRELAQARAERLHDQHQAVLHATQTAVAQTSHLLRLLSTPTR